MLTWFDPVLSMMRFKPPHTDTYMHLPNDTLNFKAECSGLTQACKISGSLVWLCRSSKHIKPQDSFTHKHTGTVGYSHIRARLNTLLNSLHTPPSTQSYWGISSST